MMENYRWTSAGTTVNSGFWNSVCIDKDSQNIYSIGGCGKNYSNYNYWNFFDTANRLDTISIYNINTKQTTEINPSYPCTGCASGYYNGAIYLVGGWYSNGIRTTSNNSGTLYYYQWTSLDIVKYVLSGSDTGIVNIQTLSTKINNPGYVQDGSKLYIFGGGTVTSIGDTHSGYNNTAINTNQAATFDGDQRRSYIFDMESECLNELPDLPIRGGLSIRCCKFENDIFIRNRTEFCKYNILTKKYTTLTSFDQTNSNDIPEIFPINIDGVDYICSCGGITSSYQQLYNIQSNTMIESILKFPLRQDMRSVVYENKPYIMGGYQATSPITNTSMNNIMTLEEVV